MDPVLLTTFGTLIVLLIFTVPIGVSIGTAVFMGMMVGGLPPVFLAQKMYSALDSFPLLAVPFFIVAGDIMQKGTIANSLLAVSRCLVGHIKGGMAHISILTSLFYGALSGSAAATVAAVGGIMIPAMEKEGYPKEFATAVNSTSGCLGIMIPPSIPLILFGSTAGVSISDLFVATIVPGILMGCALMLVSYVICVRRKYGKTVARAKFAVMLVKYLQSKGIDCTVAGEPIAFADADQMTQEENDAFQALYQFGIFKGVGGYRMDAQGSTTRAQLAVLLHRLSVFVKSRA